MLPSRNPWTEVGVEELGFILPLFSIASPESYTQTPLNSKLICPTAYLMSTKLSNSTNSTCPKKLLISALTHHHLEICSALSQLMTSFQWLKSKILVSFMMLPSLTPTSIPSGKPFPMFPLLHSSHTGLLADLQTHQAHSCLVVFVLTGPSAWFLHSLGILFA